MSVTRSDGRLHLTNHSGYRRHISDQHYLDRHKLNFEPDNTGRPNDESGYASDVLRLKIKYLPGSSIHQHETTIQNLPHPPTSHHTKISWTTSIKRRESKTSLEHSPLTPLTPLSFSPFLSHIGTPAYARQTHRVLKKAPQAWLVDWTHERDAQSKKANPSAGPRTRFFPLEDFTPHQWRGGAVAW